MVVVFADEKDVESEADGERAVRFGRIRDIRVGPKGYIYFLTDETDGGLYKISSLD